MSSLSDLIIALTIPFGFIVAAGGCMMYNAFCKKSTSISRSHEVTIICDDPHVTINVVYAQPNTRVGKVKPIVDCSDPV